MSAYACFLGRTARCPMLLASGNSVCSAIWRAWPGIATIGSAPAIGRGCVLAPHARAGSLVVSSCDMGAHDSECTVANMVPPFKATRSPFTQGVNRRRQGVTSTCRGKRRDSGVGRRVAGTCLHGIVRNRLPWEPCGSTLAHWNTSRFARAGQCNFRTCISSLL